MEAFDWPVVLPVLAPVLSILLWLATRLAKWRTQITEETHVLLNLMKEQQEQIHSFGGLLRAQQEQINAIDSRLQAQQERITDVDRRLAKLEGLIEGLRPAIIAATT